MRIFLITPLLAGLLAAAMPGAGEAQAKPLRHLAYNFDITFTTDETVHDSGIGGGPASGMAENYAGQADKGQITLDVLQAQPDGGLVVQIAEQAQVRRQGAPTMCVIYGSGMVICDQTKGDVNEEEMTLLRVAGRDFINRSQIDSKNHWRTAQTSPALKETNDYTIVKDAAGMLSIEYVRTLQVSGAQTFTATSNGSLVYDSAHTVPQSVKEETVTRKHIDQNRDDRVDQQITLALATDSMQSAAK